MSDNFEREETKNEVSVSVGQMTCKDGTGGHISKSRKNKASKAQLNQDVTVSDLTCVNPVLHLVYR